MSVVVGVLTIDLKANTASFSQSMDKMSSLSAKTANDIKRSLEKITLFGVAMAGAIATATTATIKSAIDSADALGKMAASAGTTAETLTVLAYAAGLSNVSTEDLGKGLTKLSVAAFKAQNGNTALQRVFERVGVSATGSNGKIKDSGVLMEELSTKFSKMATSGGKTALAVQLFGKSGATLIPLLNQLGEEQAKVTEEAHRFGLVMGTSTTDLAEKAHDNLDRLHLMLKGIGYSLLGAVLPALDGLLERLVAIARNANIPDLAKSFGAGVTRAIQVFGDSVDFAVTHIDLLKIALASLAGIQVAKIAIPVIGDLAASGSVGKIGEGLTKMLLGFAGLGKVVPQLTAFAGWVSYTSKFVLLLAESEGIAAAATYVFGGAIAVLTAPAVLAMAAIAALGLILYKFRDSTFALGDSTYKLRDTWNAAWIAMGWAVNSFSTWFGGQISEIKSIWSGLTSWITENRLSKFLADDFTEANNRLEGYVGKLLSKLNPGKLAKAALDQAKNTRETSRFLSESATDITPALATTKARGKEAPDTTGLGKEKEDPTNKFLANLKERLDESKQTLAAAGLEEAAQRRAIATNKANNEIMKLGQEIAKQTGSKTKDYIGLVSDEAKEIAKTTESILSENAALAALKDLIQNSARATALNISQTTLMTQATNEGGDAVRRQLAIQQAWNELRIKGGTLQQILARSQDIFSDSVAKEEKTINDNTISMGYDLAARRLITDATLKSVDAQDAAALSAKLYAIDVQIATTKVAELREGLLKQRQAMIDSNAEDQLRKDAENARDLRSPAAKGADQTQMLDSAAAALRTLNGGTISYAENLQITAKAQENFNRLTDETIRLLLTSGSASDGMKAFFLDMQRNAVTTGQIIYEALHNAFQKVGDSITELITGGKADFGKMFADVGKQMVNASVKQTLQKGLGAVGNALGINVDALKGKPDGSQGNPLWVKIAAGVSGAAAGLGSLFSGSDEEGGDSKGGFGGFMSSLFGALIPHAGGGPVSPGSAYMVGERGPEMFLSGVGGSVIPNNRLGGDPSIGDTHYNIDARGANDPAAIEAAVNRGIRAAAPGIAAGGAAAVYERRRRSPLTAR